MYNVCCEVYLILCVILFLVVINMLVILLSVLEGGREGNVCVRIPSDQWANHQQERHTLTHTQILKGTRQASWGPHVGYNNIIGTPSIVSLIQPLCSANVEEAIYWLRHVNSSPTKYIDEQRQEEQLYIAYYYIEVEKWNPLTVISQNLIMQHWNGSTKLTHFTFRGLKNTHSTL